MLYANTDDGSSALWVLDDDGVVIDNISIYGAERAPILEQINEHYGTSFTGWSDNEIGLRFGDSLPNWNAYEKIEMPILVAISLSGGSSPMIFGNMKGNTLYIDAKDNIMAYIATTLGVVTGGQAKIEEENKQIFISKVTPTYPNITNLELILASHEVNESLANWSNYEKFGE